MVCCAGESYLTYLILTTATGGTALEAASHFIQRIEMDVRQMEDGEILAITVLNPSSTGDFLLRRCIGVDVDGLGKGKCRCPAI